MEIEGIIGIIDIISFFVNDSFSKNYFNFLSLIMFPKLFSDCSRGLG